MVPQEFGAKIAITSSTSKKGITAPVPSNTEECDLFKVQPVMFFPGCEGLGELSSWWELALPHLLRQGCADLLQLRRKTALHLECAFSCTEKADSSPKL